MSFLKYLIIITLFIDVYALVYLFLHFYFISFYIIYKDVGETHYSLFILLLSYAFCTSNNKILSILNFYHFYGIDSRQDLKKTTLVNYFSSHYVRQKWCLACRHVEMFILYYIYNILSMLIQ